MKGVTSVTVSVPLTIRRRGGRKAIIGPDGVERQAKAIEDGIKTVDAILGQQNFGEDAYGITG